MLGDERLQLAQYGVVAAERELGLAGELERVQPPLLEPFPLGLGERLGAEVGERRAVPEPERLAEQARGRGGAPGSELPAGAADQRFEALQVELAGLEDDPVARAACLDPLGAERLPEPGDVDLERLDRRGRRLLAQSASTRESRGTASPERSSSAASSARCFGRPRSIGPPSARTSTGPRIRNSMLSLSPDVRPAKPTPSGC
jgi:hypothetical protein